MQISIGLDIGQDSIKGIRIARTLRGLRLVDSFERKVPREGAAALNPTGMITPSQVAVLKELIEEGKIGPGELVAVSLPGQIISTREMSLPFTDPKKLRQIVPFEVESQLPFDLEDVVIDYQILGPGPGGPDAPTSQILVSAVPKTVLRRYLGTLQEIGIDPAWVGIDAVSLLTFYQYFLTDKKTEKGRGKGLPSELLLIDMGASKTVLCDVRAGRLNWIRTIPVGSDLLTEALQKELGLSWEKAERLKEEADLNEISPAVAPIQKALLPWLMEIEKSLRLAERPSDGSASHFYLCGGGGMLGGLSELLSRELEMKPVSLDEAMEGRTPSIAGFDALDPSRLSRHYVQAAALALPAEGTSGLQINFRQGEFVFGKETIEKRHRFVSLALISLLLLGLMGADLYFRYSQKERRYQEVRREIREAFTAMFPQTKNVANEVEQTRAAISDLNRTGAFLGVGQESPLEVLKEITTGVPMEVRIDVQEFAIDGNKIRIEAQTDSYDSVDRIRNGLMKVAHFQEVNVSDAKVTSDQSKVNFRIQMSVKGNKETKKERR